MISNVSITFNPDVTAAHVPVKEKSSTTVEKVKKFASKTFEKTAGILFGGPLWKEIGIALNNGISKKFVMVSLAYIITSPILVPLDLLIVATTLVAIIAIGVIHGIGRFLLAAVLILSVYALAFKDIVAARRQLGDKKEAA